MISQASAATRAPLPLLAAAFAGALVALAGGYWDDAWHTERGRDTFFIAPHIAIYAGIASAGAALSIWALLVLRRDGVAAVGHHPPLVLAVISVGLTLASGPIDNAWHLAFGRDSVIWSPPHMLGIAGTLGLGAAILAEVATWPGRRLRPPLAIAGGLVLAAAGFVSVEYDTDVPQFDELFYLPVLALGAGVGLALVRAATDARWAATSAALVHLGFIVAVSGFLTFVDFSPPALPLLILPAVVVDVAAARRWSAATTGSVFALALHGSYVPVRNGLGDGVSFDAADVLLGGVLTALAGILVFTLARVAAGDPPPRTAGASSAAALLVALTVFAAPGPSTADAHDPGQGDVVGSLALRVSSDGRAVRLEGTQPGAVCRNTEAVAMVARRAGDVVRAPLTADGCRISGALRVPGRGRWFVYAELRRDGRAVESWLPLTVRSGRAEVRDVARYTYEASARASSGWKIAGAVALYGAMVGLIVAAFRLVARRGG